MPAGRPRTYNEEELQKKWNEYVEYCTTFTKQHPTGSGKVVDVHSPRVPTVGGFAKFLKIDPDTLLNYEKDGELFGTVKGIKNFIKNWKVDSLVNGEGNTTGLIFDLKANYGMKETQVQELKHQVKTINFKIKE